MEDYKLKWIGDDWKFLPEEEWKPKFKYDRLIWNINRREKRISRMEEELKNVKNELREWKKERTKQYHNLVKYHKKFTPSFTYSLSKTKKINRYFQTQEYSLKTRGNESWTIIVSYGGKRKQIYLGTNFGVCKYLDLIEGKTELDKYSELHPEHMSHHRDEIKDRLNELLSPLIKKRMLRWLNNQGNIDGWMDKKYKIDMLSSLRRIYKNSEFYEPPTPKRPNSERKYLDKFVVINKGYIKGEIEKSKNKRK